MIDDGMFCGLCKLNIPLSARMSDETQPRTTIQEFCWIKVAVENVNVELISSL